MPGADSAQRGPPFLELSPDLAVSDKGAVVALAEKKAEEGVVHQVFLTGDISLVDVDQVTPGSKGVDQQSKRNTFVTQYAQLIENFQGKQEAQILSQSNTQQKLPLAALPYFLSGTLPGQDGKPFYPPAQQIIGHCKQAEHRQKSGTGQ